MDSLAGKEQLIPANLESANSPEAGKLYWPQLDGLRFLAFFLVFLHHLPLPPSLQQPQLPEVPRLLMMLSSMTGIWGWIGVELFFVLSAFLITRILLQEKEIFGKISFRSFITRRILRIWPLYYVVGIFTFLIFPLVMGSNNSQLQWQELLNRHLLPYLTFLFNFSLPTPIEIPMYLRVAWSVSIEEQFYLAWGLLLLCIRRVKALALIVALAFPFTWLVRFFLFQQSTNHQVYYYNTFAHLDPILVGISVAMLLYYQKINLESLKSYGAALGIIPVLFYIALIFFAPPIYIHYDVFLLLFPLISVGCGLMLLSCLMSKTVAGFFSIPILRWLGRLTYGAYFIHCFAINIIFVGSKLLMPQLLNNHPYWSWLSNSMLSLLFTFVLAFVSWHLLEKHFHKFRQCFSKIPSGFG